MRKKKRSAIRLADVHFVYSLALQKAFEPHMIEHLLKEAGRDRARREVVRTTVRKYLEAEDDFDGGATPKRWAELVNASRKLHALLKAPHPRRSKEVSPDDTFSRALALGGLAHKLVESLASKKKVRRSTPGFP